MFLLDLLPRVHVKVDDLADCGLLRSAGRSASQMRRNLADCCGWSALGPDLVCRYVLDYRFRWDAVILPSMISFLHCALQRPLAADYKSKPDFFPRCPLL